MWAGDPPVFLYFDNKITLEVGLVHFLNPLFRGGANKRGGSNTNFRFSAAHQQKIFFQPKAISAKLLNFGKWKLEHDLESLDKWTMYRHQHEQTYPTVVVSFSNSQMPQK